VVRDRKERVDRGWYLWGNCSGKTQQGTTAKHLLLASAKSTIYHSPCAHITATTHVVSMTDDRASASRWGENVRVQ
jgi:hypothetical protein